MLRYGSSQGNFESGLTRYGEREKERHGIEAKLSYRTNNPQI